MSLRTEVSIAVVRLTNSDDGVLVSLAIEGADFVLVRMKLGRIAKAVCEFTEATASAAVAARQRVRAAASETDATAFWLHRWPALVDARQLHLLQSREGRLWVCENWRSDTNTHTHVSHTRKSTYTESNNSQQPSNLTTRGPQTPDT